MKFDTVGFIGLGLIGGSIAKKIRHDRPSTKIIATAGHEETVAQAHRMGLTENDALLPIDAFSDCDLIFLCAPVAKNIEYLRQLKGIIKDGCIITDVGSTKAEIHKEAKCLGMTKNFIGGHPMTGSEKTGIKNASEEILDHAYYIITPTEDSSKEEVDEYVQFVKSLGSIPLVLDPQTHDYMTAAISHLPHMMAFSLVRLISRIDDDEGTMRKIAAGGFLDMTRIAASSPVMWENICASNRESIAALIDSYIEELTALREKISSADSEALLEYFEEAKKYRDSF